MRETHLLGCTSLRQTAFFLAIVRDIIDICLVCAGAQEKIRQAGRKVTKSIYFTFAWSDL